jgi:hypothetical protein
MGQGHGLLRIVSTVQHNLPYRYLFTLGIDFQATSMNKMNRTSSATQSQIFRDLHSLLKNLPFS